MPAAKLRPVGPSTTTRPPVMYSQPWSPDALDHGRGARVAHGEALAGQAAEERAARGGAVEHGVADDHVLLGAVAGRLRRAHGEDPAREALARVVVGLALQRDLDARRQPGAERLAGRAREVDADRALGQALAPVTSRDLAGQDPADGAVHVAQAPLEDDALAVLERGLGLARSAASRGWSVERGLRSADAVARRRRGRRRASASTLERSTPRAFQWSIAASVSSRSARPISSSKRPDAQRGHQLAGLLGHEEEELHDVLGRAGEALAQHRVLRGDADRARVEVADAHHDAAHRDRAERSRSRTRRRRAGRRRSRRGRCASARRPRRGSGERRSLSSSVCWVSARPISHGTPALWIEDCGEAPVPPSWPATVTWSAPAFATPAATVPTPTSATSLTETAAVRVGACAGRRSAA